MIVVIEFNMRDIFHPIDFLELLWHQFLFMWKLSHMTDAEMKHQILRWQLEQNPNVTVVTVKEIKQADETP